MVGQHQQLNGRGFGWTPEVGDRQVGLACCGLWGHKESDTTEWLNWTELFKWCSFITDKSTNFKNETWITVLKTQSFERVHFYGKIHYHLSVCLCVSVFRCKCVSGFSLFIDNMWWSCQTFKWRNSEGWNSKLFMSKIWNKTLITARQIFKEVFRTYSMTW